MLNIFNEKLNNSIEKKHYNLGNNKRIDKHYPPANKEWLNSIYAYNKNTTKLLPIADKALLKLLKIYFNLYSNELEKKLNNPTRYGSLSLALRLKLRRLSVKRTLVSRAELKHTSEKVNITIYIYNGHLNYYINSIKKMALLNKSEYKRKPWKAKQKIRIIAKKGSKIISNVLKQKEILFKTLNTDKSIFSNYENEYIQKFILKSLLREVTYLYMRKVILINKFKFNSNFLLPLTSLIEKFYKKKIEFNLVKLKYLYLNSYIFTDTLVKKILNKKNYLVSVLRRSLIFKIPPINRRVVMDEMYNKKKIPQNLKVNHILSDHNHIYSKKKEGIQKNINYSDDNIDSILKKKWEFQWKEKQKLNYNDYNSDLSLKEKWKLELQAKKKEKEDKNVLLSYNNKKIQNKLVKRTVLDSIKYKYVKGIRIEAAGRLTWRYTASRSIFKKAYKGNIRNFESSYKKLPTVVLRGHFKSNLEYTYLSSKKRIGSFGIKGWVSSSN